jgi:hypothetical protein
MQKGHWIRPPQSDKHWSILQTIELKFQLCSESSLLANGNPMVLSEMAKDAGTADPVFMYNTRQSYSFMTPKHLFHILINFPKAFNYTQRQCQFSLLDANRNPQLLMAFPADWCWCEANQRDHLTFTKEPQFTLALGPQNNLPPSCLLYSIFRDDKMSEDYPVGTGWRLIFQLQLLF